MMRKWNAVVVLLLVVLASSCQSKQKDSLNIDPTAVQTVRESIGGEPRQNGDIIFQTSRSSQSKAIQIATKSRYSHCGMIFKRGNDYFVYEAAETVKRTPLDQWIARGADQHYVIKRLKNADQVLTTEVLNKMKEIGASWEGKDYDLAFEWSDQKMYCSELVWKLYKLTTDLEVGKLQTLKDFDLSHTVVQKKIKERYGDAIPLEERVISPQAVFESSLLETVQSN